MRVRNNTKRILFIAAVCLLTALMFFPNSVISGQKPQPQQKQEDITAKRASKTQDGLNFCLTVIPGGKTQQTLAVVTITNMSDKEVVVPTPLVMPLAGTLGYKNTIQIKNEKGVLLKMTGLHGDYAERPTTKLQAPPSPVSMNFHSRSYFFELDNNFPEIIEPGQYTIDFRLISDEAPQNRSTWKGTVDLSVSISKGGPYKIEPQKAD